MDHLFIKNGENRRVGFGGDYAVDCDCAGFDEFLEGGAVVLGKMGTEALVRENERRQQLVMIPELYTKKYRHTLEEARELLEKDGFKVYERAAKPHRPKARNPAAQNPDNRRPKRQTTGSR